MFVTREQMARAQRWREGVGRRWASLSEREREVLELLAEGQSTQQIAVALSIEKSTVDTHVGNVLTKLGVASRAQAVTWVWKHGVFEEMDTCGELPSNLAKSPDKNGDFPDDKPPEM